MTVILRHLQAIQQSLQVKRKGILSIIENKHRRAVTTAVMHICILSSRRSPNNIEGDHFFGKMLLSDLHEYY